MVYCSQNPQCGGGWEAVDCLEDTYGGRDSGATRLFKTINVSRLDVRQQLNSSAAAVFLLHPSVCAATKLFPRQLGQARNFGCNKKLRSH
jgi:hypothetical protein